MQSKCSCSTDNGKISILNWHFHFEAVSNPEIQKASARCLTKKLRIKLYIVKIIDIV